MQSDPAVITHLNAQLKHELTAIDWLETQPGLIDQIGLPNYLQSSMSSPS